MVKKKPNKFKCMLLILCEQIMYRYKNELYNHSDNLLSLSLKSLEHLGQLNVPEEDFVK